MCLPAIYIHSIILSWFLHTFFISGFGFHFGSFIQLRHTLRSFSCPVTPLVLASLLVLHFWGISMYTIYFDHIHPPSYPLPLNPTSALTIVSFLLSCLLLRFHILSSTCSICHSESGLFYSKQFRDPPIFLQMTTFHSFLFHSPLYGYTMFSFSISLMTGT